MSLRIHKGLYLGFSSILALAAGQTAWAQDQAQTSAPSTAAVEEIVVTAQKRGENVEKVPVAVSAFTGQTLQKLSIENTTDLAIATPGLRIDSQIGYSLASIRGIGNYIVTPGAESDVAIYIDGVYQANLYTTMFNFIGIDRIEVLKGPQGTLFGRNAVAGVINVFTRDPSSTPEAELEATLGNYDEKKIAAYISGPLSAKASANLSAYFEEHDAYQKNVLAGGPPLADTVDYGIRGKVLLTPTDDFKLTFSADAARNHDASTAFGNRQVNALPYILGGRPSNGFYDVNINSASYANTTSYGGSVNGELGLGQLPVLGDAELVSITGYRFVRFHPYVDDDAGPITVFNFDQRSSTDSTFTQEVRLQSVGDTPFTWQVGGYYFNDVPKNTLDFVSDILQFNLQERGEVDREAYAFYTQESYKITDALKITGGVRFNQETDVLERLDQVLPAGPDGIPDLTIPIETAPKRVVVNAPNVGANKVFSSFTYHGSIDYDFGPVLAYASISSGFKSGAFNLTDETGGPPTNPEKITSYEIGAKANFFDHTLTLNTAAFEEDYTNLQVQEVIPGQGGATTTQNAASAQVRGAEVDFKQGITPELLVYGGLAYLDPHYVSFPNYAAIVTLPRNAPPNANPGKQINASGNMLNYASRFSVNLGFNYDLDLGTAGDVDLTGIIYFATKYYLTPDNNPLTMQNDYYTLNMEATYHPSFDENLSIKLWGKNLTDQQRYGYGQVETFSTPYSPAPPLTFGATVKYKFGGEEDQPATTAAVYVPPPVQAPALAPKSYLVFFDFNKSDLTPQATEIVDTAAKNAAAGKVAQLTVTGHTDTVGSDAYNMRLSRRRAESVAAELEKDGIASSEIEIVAKGKRDLLVPTKDGVREPQNRRVQIVFDGGPTS
jgi:iron complex outermembrane receptor protein